MKDLTIIIPTYNRSNSLNRVLSFYNSFNEEVNVIVADSSSDEIKKLNKKIVLSFTGMNILYIDHYKDNINPFQKFADSAQCVTTEFSVFCGDEDFITREGIERSIVFLKTNPDYSVAHGRYLSLLVNTNTNKDKKFRWCFGTNPVSIEFNDAIDRFRYHLSEYVVPTIYGVHRSNAFMLAYGEELKNLIDPFIFGELLASLITVILGKVKYLDTLYAVRSARKSGRSYPSIPDSVKDGTYFKKYTEFKRHILSYLAIYSDLKNDELGKIIDMATEVYLKKSYPKDSLSTRKSKKKVLIESLHLPKVLNEKMIAAYVAINRLGNLQQGKKVFVNESLLDISNEDQVSIQRIKDIYVRNYNK